MVESVCFELVLEQLVGLDGSNLLVCLAGYFVRKRPRSCRQELKPHSIKVESRACRV